MPPQRVAGGLHPASAAPAKRAACACGRKGGGKGGGATYLTYLYTLRTASHCTLHRTPARRWLTAGTAPCGTSPRSPLPSHPSSPPQRRAAGRWRAAYLRLAPRAGELPAMQQSTAGHRSKLRCTQAQARRRGTRASLKPPPGLTEASCRSGSRTCNAPDQLRSVRAEQRGLTVQVQVRMGRICSKMELHVLMGARSRMSESPSEAAARVRSGVVAHHAPRRRRRWRYDVNSFG